MTSFSNVVKIVFSLSVDTSPKQARDGIWSFSRIVGGTLQKAWWLDCDPEPVLIDCPEVSVSTIESLEKLCAGRSPKILLTNREAHQGLTDLYKALGWRVLVQEQEAYLLPEISPLETFAEQYETLSGLRMLWTPGPTPGSCVIYAPAPWNVLFCGRLLIPNKSHKLSSFPNRSSFHRTRYQKSLQRLVDWIPSNTRPLLASGAGSRTLPANDLFEWNAWSRE